MSILPVVTLSYELPCILKCGKPTLTALIDATAETEPAWVMYPLCGLHLALVNIRIGEAQKMALWTVINQMVEELHGEVGITYANIPSQENDIEYWKVKHTLDKHTL